MRSEITKWLRAEPTKNSARSRRYCRFLFKVIEKLEQDIKDGKKAMKEKDRQLRATKKSLMHLAAKLDK